MCALRTVDSCYTYKTSRLKFIVELDHVRFTSDSERSPKSPDANYLQWKFKKRFDLSITRSNLMEKNIVFQILNEDGQVEGVLQRELSFSVTGPYHHDFSINLKSAKGARLGFDLRMNQKFDMNVKVSRLQVDLLERMMEKSYRFKIKHLDENYQCQSSEYSPQFNNPSYSHPIERLNEDEVEQVNHKIHWEKEDGPQLWVAPNSHQTYHSCFQVIIDGVSLQGVQQTITPIGQFFMSISELMQGCKENSPNSKTIQRKLWNHGVLIGQAICQLQVFFQPFIHQIDIGYQSQHGIVKGQYVVYNSQVANGVVKELNELKDRLIDCIVSIEKQFSAPSVKQIRDCLLKISFQLNNKKNIYANQRLIIDIGNTLISSADSMDERLKDHFYKVLIDLTNSSELSLYSLGFGKKFKPGKSAISVSKTKLQIGQAFFNFMVETLAVFIDKASAPALSQLQNRFVHHIGGRLFFKLKSFQHQLLECIRVKDGFLSQFIQDRLSNLGRTQDSQNRPQLDWDSYLFNYLAQEEEMKKGQQRIADLLSNQAWRQKISTRGVLFYKFLINWLELVQGYFPHGVIPWPQMPGWQLLLRSLLYQMKSLDIEEFPQIMKQAAIKFLKYDKLIEFYVHILFRKTRSSDVQGINNMLSFLNKLLQQFLKQKKLLPSQFNFSFLMKGVRILLNHQHEGVISKILWIFYNNFDVFPKSFCNQLSLMFLQKYFVNFMAHWSLNLRNMFIHLLVFKIHQTDRQDKNYDLQVRIVYDKTIQIFQRTVNLFKSLQFPQQTLQHLPLHKRMRKKIGIKKRGASVHQTLDQISQEIKNIRLRQGIAPGSPISIKGPSQKRIISRKNSQNFDQLFLDNSVQEYHYSRSVTQEQNRSEIRPISTQRYKAQKYFCQSKEIYHEVLKKFKNWKAGSYPVIHIEIPADQVQPILHRQKLA